MYFSKRFFFFLATTFLILGASPGLSFAVGNIHVGNTEINPRFDASYRHDDNIYLNDGDTIKEVDDNLMIYSPGLELKNERDSFLFQLDYQADVYRYSDRDEEDKTDNTLSVLFDMKSPGGLILKLSDTFLDTADPASSELTDLDEREENTFSAELGAQFSDRLSILLTYQGKKHEYKETALALTQDRDEDIVGGKLLIALLPKTSLSLVYEHETIEYEDATTATERDSDTNRGLAGLQGQLTQKLYLSVHAGYEKREYDDVSKEDFNTTVLKLELKHEYSENTEISISGNRKNVESFFLTNTYYRENKVSFDFSGKISHKISAKINGYFGTNDYNLTDRDDDLVGAGIEFDYDIQEWLSLGVGYEYKDRDSNVDTEDYTNNQYFVSLNAQF